MYFFTSADQVVALIATLFLLLFLALTWKRPRRKRRLTQAQITDLLISIAERQNR